MNTSSSEPSNSSKSSESSSFSSSPEILTMKGGACLMSGKEETIRQARMKAERMKAQKKSSHGKSSKSSSDDDSSDNDSSDDDSSDDDSSDSNAAQPKTMKGPGSQAPRGKDFAFQHRFGNLPTAKNRTNNSIPRKHDTNIENHHIFTTFARHKLPNDLHPYRSGLTDFLRDVSSQRSGNSNPLSHLNSMVDSWTTKRNDNNNSTSIFDENIGEDGLSIQSAYDVNIDNPYHTESLAPNLVLLDEPSLLTDDDLKKSYTILTKGINDLRVQLSTNKTLHFVNKLGRTINTNIADVGALNVMLTVDDIELLDLAANNKFARIWYCRISVIV